jgi:hypothetical protein
MGNRPIGVTVLAVLAIITGVLSICGGLGSFFTFGVGLFSSLFGIGEPAGLGAGLYGLLWGAITIIFGLGLWNLRQWARLGTLLLQVINLLYAFIALFTPPHVPWVSAVIAVAILWYLTRPGVKDSFS